VYNRGPQLVTPEAVVLDLPTAGLATRVLARLVDLFVSVVGALLLMIPVGLLLGGVAALIAYLFLVLAVLVLYPMLMEALVRGRTVGKMAAGLRVVTIDGAPIHFRHAFLRALGGLLDLWTTGGVVGVISLLCSRRDRRLGDFLAGTIVLRERTSSGPPPLWAFRVPPGLEQAIDHLDVGAMTASDYEMVRSFLLRWDNFRPADRHRLAVGLAVPLAQRFRHPLAAQVGPDYYLACLGVAYQRRHQTVPGAVASPAAGWGPAPGWPGGGPSW
jgi:uncharacterized RDD family membrane protein YckC